MERSLPLALLILFTSLSSTYAQLEGGALLLKNDRVMVGQIEKRGQFYQVRFGDDSKVAIPAAQVVVMAADRLELYEHKKATIQRWEVGDHFQMTRWCIVNDLLDQAIEHYGKVAVEAGDHPRVKQLSKELQKALLENRELREYLGLRSETPSDANSPPAANSQLAVGQPGPVDNQVRFASASHLDTAMNHPEIAARFSQKVQPILVNRCSQAACHGVQSKNDLRLLEPYHRSFAKISSDNLKSVLTQIASDSSGVSPLLEYATTAHGIQREAAISLAEANLLTDLRDWIRLVQDPVVPAVGNPSLQGQGVMTAGGPQTGIDRNKLQPNANFVPFFPGVELTHVRPGTSGLKQVPRNADQGTGTDSTPKDGMPTDEEIDALDDELRKLLGEPPRQPKAANGQDPFDPEEFNRQSK